MTSGAARLAMNVSPELFLEELNESVSATSRTVAAGTANIFGAGGGAGDGIAFGVIVVALLLAGTAEFDDAPGWSAEGDEQARRLPEITDNKLPQQLQQNN